MLIAGVVELVFDVTELEVCLCDVVEENCKAFVEEKVLDVVSVVDSIVVVDKNIRLDEEDMLDNKVVL